jgi:hypothetical protein
VADPDLTPRQRELLAAFVDAWERSSHTAFDFGQGPLQLPAWPAEVVVPQRDEIRPLIHLGLLTSDPDRPGGTWRVFPSQAGRDLVGGSAQEHEALADPDRRLAVILEATVAAFEADPSQPLLFLTAMQTELVRHPDWPIEPDVVRAHDLQQLAELGLIATSPGPKSMTFWPTLAGRAAVHDAAGFLYKRSLDVEDEEEKSRLRRVAERVRAGDIAVGTVTGATSAVIRALMGL